MRHFHCIKAEGKHKGWRCWLYPFANVLGSHHDKFNIGIEFYPWTDNGLPGISFGLRADCENTIDASIKIPFLLALYVHIDAGMIGYKSWWRKLLRLDDERKYDGRNWGIRWSPSYGCVDGGSIDINLGSYDNSWSSKDPKWLSMHFYPQRFLCGKATYSEKDNGTTEHKVLIKGNRDYPDKEYTLSCKEYISTWTWKRFKKPLVITRYDVSSNEGVPHPGKGTTGYNCDEGSFSGQTCPAESRQNAVDKFVEQVYWYRKNYPL
jgi:hypothetical protein